MSSTSTLPDTIPSFEAWRDEPESHTIQFDQILGWTVKREGSDSAMAISEEEALDAIRYWKWLAEPEPWSSPGNYLRYPVGPVPTL